jgi:hypothetical protein
MELTCRCNHNLVLMRLGDGPNDRSGVGILWAGKFEAIVWRLMPIG